MFCCSEDDDDLVIQTLKLEAVKPEAVKREPKHELKPPPRLTP